MKNITVKQESLSNWREEFDIDEAKVDDKHSPEGKEKERNKRKYGNWPVGQHAQTSVRRSIHWSNRGDKKRKGAKVEEHVEGGISVETLTKDTKFLEIETVDIIKTEPIKGASNWKLEMVTEMLISEGYNDEEIVTILSEELPKIPLGPILTGAVRGAWNLSTKGVKGAYDLGKGLRGIVNRGGRDIQLTKDIISTAKKLRQPKLPKGVEVVKKGAEKRGGLVKSFKGFMQNIKNAGSNLVNRTKGKLNRTDTTKKPVEVLGGAATNPATKIKPMKNITPSPIGDGIKKVTNQIKTGATAAAVTGGVVAGSKLTGGSPSKVSTATPTPPVEKKVEAPITNDGKKEVDPSKNEKIESQPTKRELRNKRNEYLSSKEGRRARRDAALQKKKDSGFPSRRMKSGTPVNQLFNKEEITNEGIVDTFRNLLKLGKNPKHKVSDETPMGKAVTGLQKRSEANKKAMELLNHYSWRDELGLIEGNRTKGFLGSGNRKDHSKGPNEKIYVDYTKIRANAPVKTDTKVG